MDTQMKVEAEARSVMASHLKPFTPCAYFDRQLDCIRVVIADETVVEDRLNEVFTIHRAWRPGLTTPQYVGFTIKGVVNLFDRLGIPRVGVHKLVEILDAIAKELPYSAVALVRKEFSTVLDQGELSVDLALAA